MADRVFVSPGVYTSEKDLSFVTRQVGVTTLGLVGETTQGPAFQPIFVSNYDEFKSFFGGQNATKIKDTGAPKYELPYIAKSYLSQSNQLYVTRVLGFSGYEAGLAWGITLDAALDTSTVVQTTSAATTSNFIQYTANTSGVLTNLVCSNSLVQSLYDGGLLDTQLAFLGTAATGATASFGPIYEKNGNDFDGASVTIYVDAAGVDGSGNTTGTTTGTTIEYSGTGYTAIEDKLVALLRSRGTYAADETPVYDITGSTDIGYSTSITGAETDPLGSFGITGTTSDGDAFSYSLSFDNSKKNYITRVLGTGAQDGKTALFVEELFKNMFDDGVDNDQIRGINISSLIQYDNSFDNYKEEYQPAVTPWVVSELRGTNLLRLFRLHTISDGNAANRQFKISIKNIKLDDKEFDVEIRSYFDTDDKPVVLERFIRCTMDPTSANFIGKKIGTLDGEFASRSTYVLVELEEESDTSDAFPAGFVGFPVRDYQTNTGGNTVIDPTIEYKKTYTTFENKRKAYLGLSEVKGIDQDFFDYKGLPQDPSLEMYTGMTKGFHMDVDATGATIDNVRIVINSSGDTYSPVYQFDTGNAEFRSESGVEGTDYEKIYARKFTFAPYGGFDGWDIYRTRRTNTDRYTINGSRGSLGLTTEVFSNRALTNGDTGINSDYYAYLEGIWTFNNPEATNINVFATPGIDTFDNTNLIEEAIEMIEQDRADSLYIVTTPDTDASGDIFTPENAVDIIEDGGYDSNYTATYWPWIQINDTENNIYIWVPPTRDVVRNIALTDNIAFPWFAVAGVQRGDVNAIKARKKLTLTERDTLYDGRINPIATFASEGVKIWGNKTLQVKESALDRINVRRLLLQARKLISAVSIRLLFEQNDDIVRNQFLSLVNPILDNIRAERGLTDFRVVLDNDPEAIDRNELCGRIFLKPTRALEFICVEFNIMNTGASFDDI